MAQQDRLAHLADARDDRPGALRLAAARYPALEVGEAVLRREDGGQHVLVAAVDHLEQRRDRPLVGVLLAQVVDNEQVRVAEVGGAARGLPVLVSVDRVEHREGGRDEHGVARPDERSGDRARLVGLARAHAPDEVEALSARVGEPVDVVDARPLAHLGLEVPAPDARAPALRRHGAAGRLLARPPLLGLDALVFRHLALAVTLGGGEPADDAVGSGPPELLQGLSAERAGLLLLRLEREALLLGVLHRVELEIGFHVAGPLLSEESVIGL